MNFRTWIKNKSDLQHFLGPKGFTLQMHSDDIRESNDPLEHNDGKDPEDIFWIGIDPKVDPPKPGERWYRGHPHRSSRLDLALWLTRSLPDARFYGDSYSYELNTNARLGIYRDLVRAVRESGAKRSDIKPSSGWDGNNDNDFVYIPKVQKKLMDMGIDALLLSDVMTNYEIDTLVVLNKSIAKVSGKH